ncbi:hypothetical protein MRB53_038509 [Persea americana]|nr:hypothetical protein MRB53_038509 [Persea americana]
MFSSTKISARPSTADSIKWSADSDLAIAEGDVVEVLVPRIWLPGLGALWKANNEEAYNYAILDNQTGLATAPDSQEQVIEFQESQTPVSRKAEKSKPEPSPSRKHVSAATECWDRVKLRVGVFTHGELPYVEPAPLTWHR